MFYLIIICACYILHYQDLQYLYLDYYLKLKKTTYNKDKYNNDY